MIAGDMNAFDYVIVGGGTAGCVLANRLTASGRERVLVLEAGPRDDYLWIHIPIGYGKTMFHPVYNWGFYTEPEPSMHGRKVYWPRGRGLGGSSSINGLIYVRGQPQDYDRWAAAGNAGWGWRDVLPVFHPQRGELARRVGDARRRRSARLHRHRRASRADRGDHRRRRRARRAAHRRFQRRRAGRRRLLPALHAPRLALQHGRRLSQAGARAPQPRGGDRRAGDARAVRRPARGRRRVRAGRRDAAGARATREVLLAAGALQSPQLLQLSGIGDPATAARIRHSGRARRCPASAKTCRTICSCGCSTGARKPITTNDDLNSWWRSAEDRHAMDPARAAARSPSASTRAACSPACCRNRRRPTCNSISPRCRPTSPGRQAASVPGLHVQRMPAAARRRAGMCGSNRAIRSPRRRCSRTI